MTHGAAGHFGPWAQRASDCRCDATSGIDLSGEAAALWQHLHTCLLHDLVGRHRFPALY